MKTPTSAVLVVRRMPVFFAGGKGAERVAIKYRVATLPSARKARSTFPFREDISDLRKANLRKSV